MTLKKVIARLKQLADNHQMINHFFIGEAERFVTADVKYPALFVEFEDGDMSLDSRLTTFSFGLYFFDLLATASDSLLNEFDVKSDMAQIASDYMAMLYDVDYNDWDVQTSSVPMDIKEYQFSDLCAGVSLKVKIAIRFDANLCQVPIEN